MLRKMSMGVYLVLLSMVAIGHLIDKVMTGTGGIISRFLPLLFVFVLALGFYGYAFKKHIFGQVVWISLFWLLFVLTIAGVATLSYMIGISQPLNSPDAIWLVLVILLILPALLPLFNYSYRCHSVWQKLQQ